MTKKAEAKKTSRVSNINIGFKKTLHSGILKEDIKLHIRLPNNYKKRSRRYPVMYMLDGESMILPITATLKVLENSNYMPELIFVGITTDDRVRDSTPSPVNDEKHKKRFADKQSGEAEKFVSVLEKEIMPYIEKEYRTAPYRILGGHSLTGLFASYVFLHHSAIFNSYFASSPSLWWNSGEMVEEAKSAASKIKGERKIYISLGNEGGRHCKNIKLFFNEINKRSTKKIGCKFKHYRDECHGSVSLTSANHALRYFFENWNMADNETITSLRQVKNYHKKLSEHYGLDITPSQACFQQLLKYCKKNKQTTIITNIIKYARTIYPEFKQI